MVAEPEREAVAQKSRAAASASNGAVDVNTASSLAMAWSNRARDGYRVNDEAVAARVRFITSAQYVGLRSCDIKELLDISGPWACPCGHTAPAVERRLAEVNAELARLQALRRDLITLGHRNQACGQLSAFERWCAQATDGERR